MSGNQRDCFEQFLGYMLSAYGHRANRNPVL